MDMAVASTNSTEERALKLLGQGIGPEMVAAAIGVSVSRISQLLAEPEFSGKVSELRYITLSKHNERDSRYDDIEDTLQDRLESLIPLMYKPGEILNALKVVNSARRRGSSVPESFAGTREVVQLSMPTFIVQQFAPGSQNFTVNTANQVIRAGTQDLVTMQSVRMNEMLVQTQKMKALNHEHPNENGAESTP